MPDLLSDMREYFNQTRIPIRLGCTTESGWPMMVSLWYTFKEGKLYCATKDSARVVSYLRKNPECAYEISSDQPPYCGVRGQALARIDKERGQEILEELIDRYLGDQENDLARFLLKNKDQEVAIELKPVNAFSWDFSSRMDMIAPSMLKLYQKRCPEMK